MAKLDIKHLEPKPTYYVIRMDGEGKAPTLGHPSRFSAQKAAEKLAHNNPGIPFEVVKVKSTVVRTVKQIPID